MVSTVTYTGEGLSDRVEDVNYVRKSSSNEAGQTLSNADLTT
jgi:hypothetical protein